MSSEIIYDNLFKQALQRIKSVRNPNATKPENYDLGWDKISEQVLFDFSGKEYKEYSNVTKSAKNISISCLNVIVNEISKEKNIDLKPIKINFEIEKFTKFLFAYKDMENDVMLFFKEIEECCLWKIKDKEPEEVQEFLNINNTSKCKYIYLIRDYAYLQIVGHNNDETDPGRGYNFYSLKWFFENYFGQEEWELFLIKLEEYAIDINNYIGYSYIKSLTPNALINFRKIVEQEIVTFKYRNILQKTIKGKYKDYCLNEKEYEIIKNQYFDHKIYLTLTGKKEYSESLITAEWLYSTMKKAKAIDLTIIGMGYFKALEQLIYNLICLYKNENRSIRKAKSKDPICLNDKNITNENIDTTLGAMANFYKDNPDILRSELVSSKKYILESIFEYSRIRNGYFHKHNIHSWDKINEIREKTLELIFLLLGAHDLDDSKKEVLEISSSETIFDDYYKLCEYVNYHCNEIFFLNIGRENYKLGIAQADKLTEIVNEDYIRYSGVYFKEFKDNGRVFKFSKDNLPSDIYIGKLVFAQTELVNIEPVKRLKVFDNGRFIGPSIVSENHFTY